MHSHCTCRCSLEFSIWYDNTADQRASMRDYNDNTASCFTGGVSAGVCAVAPEGRSSFSGKVFPTQMRHRTGLFISAAVLLVRSIQKAWTTGCRVNVISSCVFVPRSTGVYLYADKSLVRWSLILFSTR